MAYDVSLEQFSGPLPLLLGLIERAELPITEVSLAKVAEDFLRHLDTTDVEPEELADFLVVASKLLLLKSQAILPVPVLEEDEDAGALAAQLKLYKLYADASKTIASLVSEKRTMFVREKPARAPVPAFAPPGNVSTPILHEAFQRLLKRLAPFFALREASLERVVSVQERIAHIRAALVDRMHLSFNDMISSASSKVDVVVSFLALLELVKQRVIHVAQGESFQDITITHAENV